MKWQNKFIVFRVYYYCHIVCGYKENTFSCLLLFIWPHYDKRLSMESKLLTKMNNYDENTIKVSINARE